MKSWRDPQPEDFERRSKSESEPPFSRGKKTFSPGPAGFIAGFVGLAIGLAVGEFRLQKYNREVIAFGQNQGQTQATLQKTIADLQGQISTLSNANFKLKTDNSALTKELSESSGLRTQVKDLTQKLAASEKSVSSLQSDFVKEQLKSKDLQKQVDELNKQIRLLKQGNQK